jgi:hypothetical protein
MKDASSQLKELLATDKGGQTLELPDSLRSRANFLLSFAPTGNLQLDMESVLKGTGEQGVLAVFRRYDLSLRVLAASIRHNHEDELENLSQGGRPFWSSKSEHWSPEQIEFYRRILTLEVAIFESILDHDDGSSDSLTA